MKTLTASDRSALIRRASRLPTGSDERRTLLSGLRLADEGGEEDASGGGGKPSGKFIAFMEEVGDDKVTNPDTGNKVKVKSLKGPKGKKLVQEQFKKWLESQDSDDSSPKKKEPEAEDEAPAAEAAPAAEKPKKPKKGDSKEVKKLLGIAGKAGDAAADLYSQVENDNPSAEEKKKIFVQIKKLEKDQEEASAAMSAWVDWDEQNDLANEAADEEANLYSQVENDNPSAEEKKKLFAQIKKLEKAQEEAKAARDTVEETDAFKAAEKLMEGSAKKGSDTASDRAALIRLASTLPPGSDERKTILSCLKNAGSSRSAARFPLEAATPEAFVERMLPVVDYLSYMAGRDLNMAWSGSGLSPHPELARISSDLQRFFMKVRQKVG